MVENTKLQYLLNNYPWVWISQPKVVENWSGVQYPTWKNEPPDQFLPVSAFFVSPAPTCRTTTGKKVDAQCRDVMSIAIPAPAVTLSYHVDIYLPWCGNYRCFRWLIFCLFVCLGLIVSLENFSLTWRRHGYRWRTANFVLCSALMAIEQWGFLNLPHLLWHGASVDNGHLWGPVILTPTAEH